MRQAQPHEQVMARLGFHLLLPWASNFGVHAWSEHCQCSDDCQAAEQAALTMAQ